MVRAGRSKSGTDPEPAAPSGGGFGEAEIHQLGSGLGEHDVAGLEIAVDDALAMRLVERVGDLDADLQYLRSGSAPLRKRCGKRLALEVFHHQEVDVVLGADVVEHADVGMVAGRRWCGLRARSAAEFRVGGEMSGQNLDRDDAIEARVAGAIHLAHSAGTERGLNFVRTEFCARGQGMCRRNYSLYRSGIGFRKPIQRM